MSLDRLREIQALNTLVFETLGQPEKEREFKFKELKRWGFDLIRGRKGGVETYFTAEEGKRKVGEKYEEEGVEYEVSEILTELPKNKRLYAHIESYSGRAYIVCQLREGEENIEILRVPAGSLVLSFFKKNKLNQLVAHMRNVGICVEFVKQRGQEGKPVPYEELPSVARKFLRTVKDVEKEAGFGRVALAYYGEDKEMKPRYRISWLLPTIAMFDLEIAQKADKALAMFVG